MLARTTPRAAPKKAVSGRHRTARRQRAHVQHIILPFAIVNQALPEPGETIGAFLTRTAWAAPLPPARRRTAARYGFQLPTICVVNGRPVRQREWKRRRIRETDRVEFLSRPWGGSSGSSGVSGKQIAGIVALIAIAILAPYAAGAIGLTGLAATAFTAAVTIGGGLLVAALTRPNVGGTNQDASKDQVEQLYSVAAQGNTSRLLQPLTVHYGRVKSFPDFAISPWSEFNGNDQYLNVLLGQGLGSFSYESLYIDDTILWTSGGGLSGSFTGVDIAFYEPNASVTLFPVNVTQSGEVAGQDITQTFVGGFVANASGTTAKGLAIDLVFPGGCYSLDDAGLTQTSTVTIVVEARTVDDAGAPTSSYDTYATQSYTFATRNPQRQTIKIDTNAFRYEVRVKRTTAPASSSTEVNDVIWAGLRAFIDGPSSFPVSTVAIRIKANSQLTGSSARKFGTIATRKLFVWDTGTSTLVLQATRNPFWAAYDAATDTTYGAARPPSKIDFQTVVDQAAAADARGDTFDYRFTSAVQAPEALDMCLRVARARHRWSGDVLTFVRDEWSDVPRMLLTDREIIRGSMSIDYLLNPDNAADSVIVEYVDEDIWNAAEVQYPPNSIDFTSVNPSRIRLSGVVNREHATREAGFYWLQSQLRRVTVMLDTEHDGRMLGFGSRVRIQSELPLSWGATGYVVSRASNTLLVSPAPTWGANPHYIAIRTKTGRQFGPVLCTQGVDTAHIVLNNSDLASVEAAQGMTLADALTRADGADDPSFDFGPGTSRARDCVVMTGRPSNDRVSLALVVDNFDVHTTDLDSVPSRPALPTLLDARTPTIVGLYAQFTQGVAEPMLDASWIPAPGAQYYVAQVSYDGGATRQQIYEGLAPRLDRVPVDRAALRLYVAGVGVRHGPYSTVDLDAPVIVIAPGTVNVDSLIASLGQRVTDGLKSTREQIETIVQWIASQATEQDAQNFLDKVQSKSRDGTLKTLIDDVTGDLNSVGARVTIAEETIVTGDEAFATLVTDITTNYTTSDTASQARTYTQSTATSKADAAISTYNQTVSTSLGGLSATVSGTFTSVSGINSRLAASYALTLDVNGYVSGFKLLSNGVTSFAAFAVDHFTVGTSGVASVPVFDIGTVGGVATIILRGSLLADGTIGAQHIAARSIDTSKIAINGVDIINIIEGAVGIRSTVGTNAVSTSGNGSTVASQTVNIQNTTRHVRAYLNLGNVSSVGGSISSGGPGTFHLSCYVDGVLRETQAYTHDSGTGGFVGAWQYSKCIQTYFELPPLAAGNHTFTVILDASGTTTTLPVGKFTIEELRR